MTSRRDDTYSTAETVSEEGVPPDPGEAVVVEGTPLRARGRTLEPELPRPPSRTGTTGSGGAPSKDVAHLWMLRAGDERRLFRAELLAGAALVCWGGTLLVVTALGIGVLLGRWGWL